jgi:hypothetical protein
LGHYRRAAYAVTSSVTATSANSGFVQVIGYSSRKVIDIPLSATAHRLTRVWDASYYKTQVEIANIQTLKWLLIPGGGPPGVRPKNAFLEPPARRGLHQSVVILAKTGNQDGSPLVFPLDNHHV